MYLIDSPIPKAASLAGSAGLLNLLLQKAEVLADFDEILDFICRILKRGDFARVATLIGNFSLLQSTRLVFVFFNWKPRLHQQKSETCCFEEFRVWLGTVFPSRQSLPFSEFGRFGITNQTHPLSIF